MRSAKFQLKVGRPPSLLLLLLATLGVFVSRNAFATDYYVAATGSDSNQGTLTQPFATLQKGADVAAAGDTVYIRGGTYSVTTPISSGAGIAISKSGTSDTNRINFFAYMGEIPLFDFTNLKISTTSFTHGIVVTGSWLHFKGLEVCCVPMNTFSNNGVEVKGASNDIFELLNMHHNSGNGMFINGGNGGHLILNCDGHDNYDATSTQGQGQNADGFGHHYQTAGATSIFRGCRAWWNSDDGYDLINQEVPVTVENSWAFGNGFANYGTFSPSSGNGNGFKMGSSKTGIRHLVQNNVAWKNKANGFYANHSSGGNTWYNNTSFNNGTQFNMLASPAGSNSQTIILTGALAHIMRNNVGYPDKNSNMGGVDTAFNTWDLNITPAAADFLSVTDPTVTGTGQSIEGTGALGPRQADGSLPNVDFLKLAARSTLIDKGKDVGLHYVGAAPDLGAYEYGAGSGGASSGSGTSSSSGGSGASSSGGASGSGGGGGSGSGGPAATSSTSSGGGTGGASSSGGGSIPGGGSSGVGMSSSGAASDGGSAVAGGGGAAPGSSASGCGCRMGTSSSRDALYGALGLAGLCSGRRRRKRIQLGRPV